jgi:transposase
MKQDGRTLDHNILEHLRLSAVQRFAEGEKPSAIMASMGLCRTTIYRWIRQSKRGQSLLSTQAPGRIPKLTPAQGRQVRRWVVGKDPRQYGFEFGLWTRKIVADLIAQRFGIFLGLSAVGRLLARLEITPQKPLRRAYERDPQAVEQWIKKDYVSLRRRARRHGAEIFFLDEAGFSSEPNLGRTYGLKGQTPIVPTTGKRQKINALSAINAKGAFWSKTYTGTLNAERFEGFLKAFRKGRRTKIYLVVDGHPSHKANRIKNYIQSTQGALELHFLPPYAPDLNPDEFVWHYAKINGTAKKPLRKDESLKQRVEADLASIGSNKKLVRSFFSPSSVAYAKD